MAQTDARKFPRPNSDEVPNYREQLAHAWASGYRDGYSDGSENPGVEGRRNPYGDLPRQPKGL